MKSALVMLCILGASFLGSAQDKNFDLSKYKFPDYKRHELELNFNSSGRSSRYSQDLPNSTGDGTTVRKDNSNSYFNSNFSLGYKYDYLTRKRIDHLYSTFSGQLNYSMSNSYGEKTKQFSPEIDWYLTGFKRYYLKENKFFLEGMTDLQYYFNETKITYPDKNWNDYRDSQNHLTLSVGFGLGTGRMEKVSDLWQAYYILEKLRGQKSLVRELEEKDIFEFAGFASKLKNKRFFDTRLRKIAELKALDSLLHVQGLINDTDISYFTTLNDYWNYGNFGERESGRVIKFSLLPEYTRIYNKQNGTSSEISDKYSVISSISFKCTKQMNLFWERYSNVQISAETLIEKSGQHYDSYPANFFSSNVNFGYGFFPDSRTSISGYLGYAGQKLVVLNSSSVIPNQWMNSIYLNLAGDYYISPQLQITGSFRIRYYDKSDFQINPIETSYNLGLRYAIF